MTGPSPSSPSAVAAVAGLRLRPRPPRRRRLFFAGVTAASAEASVWAGSASASLPDVSVERAAFEGSSAVTALAIAPAGRRLRGCPERCCVFGLAASSVSDGASAVPVPSIDPSDGTGAASPDPSFSAAVAVPVADRLRPRPRPPRRRRRVEDVLPGACSAGAVVVLPPSSGVGVMDAARPSTSMSWSMWCSLRSIRGGVCREGWQLGTADRLRRKTLLWLRSRCIGRACCE